MQKNEDILKTITTTFEVIKGYEKVKKEVALFASYIQLAKETGDYGRYFPDGVLFEGEPGMGKTLFAKALIHELQLPTYLIDGTSISNSVKDVCKEINTIFEIAKKQTTGSVIFIDEVQRMIPLEGMGVQASDTEKAILSCLLTNLDGLQKRDNVFIIMTCRDKDDFDDSLIRSGRIDKVIRINFPSVADSAKILQYYIESSPLYSAILKEEKPLEEEEYESVASRCGGFACATLQRIVKEAEVLWYTQHTEEKHLIHFILDRIFSENFQDDVEIMSAQKHDEKQQEQRTNYAIHEVGHALMKFLLTGEAADIIIAPSNSESSIKGFNLILQDDDERFKTITVKEFKQNVLILLSGMIATQIVTGTNQGGGSGDMLVIRDYLRYAFLSGFFGVGCMDIIDGYCQEVGKDRYKLSKEILEKYELITIKNLKQHKDEIIEMSRELLKKGYLPKKEAEALFRKYYRKYQRTEFRPNPDLSKLPPETRL